MFVSDQVTPNVAKALKDAGVGLVALRCAGFDGVDLKVCVCVCTHGAAPTLHIAHPERACATRGHGRAFL